MWVHNLCHDNRNYNTYSNHNQKHVKDQISSLSLFLGPEMLTAVLIGFTKSGGKLLKEGSLYPAPNTEIFTLLLV